MEFEEIENGLKATVPLITEEDIRVINNDFDGIVNRFSKMIIKEKDLAKAQYIIKKQQEQIEELKRNSIPKNKVEDEIKLITGRDDFDYVGTEWRESEVVDYLKELLEEDK